MKGSCLVAIIGMIESSVALTIGACGSSSSGEQGHPTPEAGAGMDSRADADAAPDVTVDPKNCVAPGTSPNSEGVGGYCSPKGGQCDAVGPGGVAGICTADLVGTPAHDWYCTLPCSTDGMCGAGAACQSLPTGSRCVPTSCDAFVPDSGPTDSASSDGSDADGTSDSPVESG